MGQSIFFDNFVETSIFLWYNCQKKLENYYENKKRTIKLTESKLKNIITECIKQTLKENQEYLPSGVSDIQNELIEIKRIIGYLVNDYLDSISQEQLDELGDMTQKYFQFLSGFMKKIDIKRW